MEGGFIFVWSQNIKGFEPDRPGNMKPPLFLRVLRTRGGVILEIGLIRFTDLFDLNTVFSEPLRHLLGDT